MKILILVDSLKISSGSDKFAAILGSELHNEGYDVSYLTLSDEDPKYEFKGDYHSLNEKNIYGNNFTRFLRLIKYSYKVKKVCEELEIDTMISAGDPANFHSLFSRWLFGNKVKCVITQHMNPEIYVESKIKYWMLKYFFPQADVTVCVSKEIENMLNKKFGIQNTLTIYNMMDIEGNIKNAEEKLPQKYHKLMDECDFTFINIGRLDRQKGHWFLIRSFRKVVNEHENARLFILGEGTLRKDLEKLINDLQLNANVFLLGEQDNIFPFLKNSDCFVSSSLWEGLPLVLIEALSMNLPIISPDCKTGPRELLCPELSLDAEIDYPYYGKFGILTQNLPNEEIFKSIDDYPLIEQETNLSAEMIKIIENPDLRGKYSKGQLIVSNFDKEKILTQWSKLLKNL